MIPVKLRKRWFRSSECFKSELPDSSMYNRYFGMLKISSVKMNFSVISNV